MKNTSPLIQLVNPTIIILLAVLLRLIPHPANVAPITAMALFGGVYFGKRYALGIPLLALFVSDIFLGFHDTMLFVYGSFLISGLIGLFIRKRNSIPVAIGATLFSSLQFFIITNFGVWLVSDMYAKTIGGLIQSYYFALPFFRNTLIGDVFYIAILFGAFAFLRTIERSAFKVHA